MSGADACAVEGIVIETLAHGRFRVELPNGHRLVAHGGRGAAGLKPGDKVILKVSPCDLSKGRIVLNERQQP